jgi:spermidine/putrescine transport system substrate-binding protein
MTDHRFNDPLTRRQLLRRAAAGGTVLALPSLLAACGGGSSGATGAAGGTTGGAAQVNDVLNFSNWELYIDTSDSLKDVGIDKPTTLEQFTQKTGIKVNYYEDINSNSEYFAKVQGRLSQGQGIDRDIIVSTDNDRFLGQYIEQDWVQKLDKSLIPNMTNLIDAQAHPPFDPNRDVSLPWFSGMDGLAWNKEVTGPVTSVQQLLEDPKLKGRVGIWNGMGDTLGLIMLENGDDPSKVTDASFEAAITRVQKAVDSGQIRAFYGNNYAQPLSKGDLAASMAWSGDIFLLANPSLTWMLPETGGIIWTDNMLIPLGGSVATASTYMNFVYDPTIAAQLALGAGYISSVKGVPEEAAKLNPKAAANTLVFPTDDMLSNLHQNDPAMLNNPDYIQQWEAVQGH